MNLKNLKFLSVTAVILLFISLFIYFNSQSSFKNTQQEILVKDFDQLLIDLYTIKLTSKDFQTIIEKKNDQWVLKSHDDFPANAEALRKFFYNLREAKIVDLKTSKKDLLYKLGLSKESKISLDLDNKEGVAIKNFDIGIFNYLVGGTYIKEIDSNQSFLVSSNLSTDSQGFNWMSPYLFNIGPNQVKKITIMRPFKKKVILDQSKNKLLELTFPSQKKIDEYSLNDIQRNLEGMESEGYILREKLKSQSPILKTEYQFLNSSSLKINFFDIEGDIFIALDFINIPSALLPLEKRISDSFEGGQFEISSNALLQFAFQVNKKTYDNLNIELENIN